MVTAPCLFFSPANRWRPLLRGLSLLGETERGGSDPAVKVATRSQVEKRDKGPSPTLQVPSPGEGMGVPPAVSSQCARCLTPQGAANFRRLPLVPSVWSRPIVSDRIRSCPVASGPFRSRQVVPGRVRSRPMVSDRGRSCPIAYAPARPCPIVSGFRPA